MKNILGTPVISNDFFGREKEIRELVNFIENGQSVYLYAPRRMGKTSLIKQLIQTYNEKYLFHYVNEINNNPDNHYISDFLNLIVPRNKLSEKLDNGEIIESIMKVVPENKTLVFAIDEFDFLIEQYSTKGTEKINDLLELHRYLRHQNDKRIVFLYAGEEQLYRYPILLKNLNDISTMSLKPLTEMQSFNLIDKLAVSQGIEIMKNVSRRIFEFSNGIPFNIQLLFSHIVSDVRNKIIDTLITKDELDKVIDKTLYELKQYQFHRPPQNDKFQVDVEINSIIDLTNKK